MARSATTKQSPGHDAAIDQLGGERSEGMRAQRTQRTKERSMHVGMMMVFASYGWENCPDARVWDEEIRLARLAADLGFDCLWSAEHHFNDYSFVPDNLQLILKAQSPAAARHAAE
jgi:Luciferase-like monooxygenase